MTRTSVCAIACALLVIVFLLFSKSVMASQVAPLAEPFILDGQKGWRHDEGHSGGFFHTYDALSVGVPKYEAHKVHVFLPRNYEHETQRYPVLYMNDGQTAFFSGGTAGKSWHTAETLSTLYLQKALDKIIVVAIHPVDRDREYTHEPVDNQRPCCGLPTYARYLAENVKPWIDSHYRTRVEREFNAVLGSSHGGLAAFYTAAKYPQLFGSAGCMSSSFWVGIDTRPWDPFLTLDNSKLIAETANGLNYVPHVRFWTDWGLLRDGGFHNSWIEANATKRGKEMVELLQEKFNYQPKTDLWNYEDPKGEHTEDSWARRLPMVLQMLFPQKQNPRVH